VAAPIAKPQVLFVASVVPQSTKRLLSAATPSVVNADEKPKGASR
jgi:hypothetical protein